MCAHQSFLVLVLIVALVVIPLVWLHALRLVPSSSIPLVLQSCEVRLVLTTLVVRMERVPIIIMSRHRPVEDGQHHFAIRRPTDLIRVAPDLPY